MTKNLEDLFKRQSHRSSPQICKEMLKALPKKVHRPVPTSVAQLQQRDDNSGQSAVESVLDDSFDDSCIGVSDDEEVEKEVEDNPIADLPQSDSDDAMSLLGSLAGESDGAKSDPEAGSDNESTASSASLAFSDSSSSSSDTEAP